MNQEKKTYHHGDLQQQLILAAVEMLKEEGEQALSMRKLATRLGVSRMAPYHHFPDKTALLCTIAEQGFDLFSQALHSPLTLMDRASEGSGYNRNDLRVFIDSYLNFAVQHSEYYNLMFGPELWAGAEVTQNLKKTGHGSFKRYLTSLESLKASNKINPDLDALRFAQLSWSMMHGMSRLVIDRIYVDESVLDSMIESATDTLWCQLRASDQP